MASARALNHILLRRHLIIHMPNFSYCLSIVPSIKHSACYSTKKSVSKVDSNETNNKIQIGTAEVGKFHMIYVIYYIVMYYIVMYYTMAIYVSFSFQLKKT